MKHAWLWRMNFQFSALPPVHTAVFGAYGALVSRGFAAAFARHDPHLVVSVHPLMQHIPLRVLASVEASTGRKRPAFATVVTDLTRCHPTWFHKSVDACFVPTQVVADQALEAGLSPSQVVLHGLPTRPAFAAPLPSKPVLRKRLGLRPTGFTVLLMGGGEGMGSLEATASAAAEALPSTSQLVVVCGRNAALRRRLTSRSWGCSLTALGFVSNVDEWMGAADCIVTKAGPGTMAEALIRGLPLLLNGAIPCQEEGNVPFVVDSGVGVFQTDPAKIAEQLAAWAGPQAAQLAAMAAKARALGRPRATFDIVKDLAALASPAAAAV